MRTSNTRTQKEESMKAMDAKRMEVTLGYLPCTAGEIPPAYRNLLTAEKEGLARVEAGYVWKLTPKGEEFLQSQMKKLRKASKVS